MKPVKHAIYAALVLLSGGLSACGPADSAEQELTQTKAGLTTCDYSRAESWLSQQDACDQALAQAPDLCADLGGVSYVARHCIYPDFSGPWIGVHYVCCNQ